MKHIILNVLRTAVARPAVLAAALSSLFWVNHANADIFESLKKAAEGVLQEEIDKVVDAQPEQPVQTQPDMAVYEAQVYLTYLGYDVGQPDGMLNERTSSAIRAYQRDSGLPVTGTVTPDLLVSIKQAYNHYARTGQKPGTGGAGSSQPAPSTSPTPPTTQTAPRDINRGSAGSASAPQTSTGTQSSAPTSSAGGLTPTATPTFGESGTSASSSGGLTPTATYEQPAAGTIAGASGLNVPARWSTVENGLVIPHPVTIDGRILTEQAIEHYGQWMGLADRRAANAALAEYLELVGAGIRPEDIEKNPMRYVMFLTKSERDRYLCPTEAMTNEELMARSSGKLINGCTSHHGELVWAGANEFETRRSRQGFIDDYRDRLIAAAPKLPIEFLDTGEAMVSHYDRTKKGFTIWSLESHAILTKGPQHRTTPPTRNEQIRGEPLSGGGINLAIYREPKITFEPNPRYSSNTINVFWPMDLAQAEALINRLWAPTTAPHPDCGTKINPRSSLCSGNAPEQKIYTRFLRTLTDYGPVSGTPTAIQSKMIASSAVAYEDPLFERELHRFNVGGEAQSAKSVQSNDSTASSATSFAPVDRDPATGEPVKVARTTGSTSIADSIAGGNGLAPLEVPLFRGAPLATYSGIGWDSETHARQNPSPLKRLFLRWQTADNPAMLGVAEYARLFLTDEMANQYMRQVRGRKYYVWGWKSLNEKENFVREFAPRIAATVPSTPFDIWLIIELRLGEYDFNRSGFPLLGFPLDLTYPLEDPNFAMPDEFLSMDPGKAENLMKTIGQPRNVYLGINVDILSQEYHAYHQGIPRGTVVNHQLKSMGLFTDRTLTQQVKRYH